MSLLSVLAEGMEIDLPILSASIDICFDTATVDSTMLFVRKGRVISAGSWVKLPNMHLKYAAHLNVSSFPP